MRIRLIFQDNLSHNWKKVWCGIHDDLCTVKNLLDFVVKKFDIEKGKYRIEIESFLVPLDMEIKEVIREGDILTVKLDDPIKNLRSDLKIFEDKRRLKNKKKETKEIKKRARRVSSSESEKISKKSSKNDAKIIEPKKSKIISDSSSESEKITKHSKIINDLGPDSEQKLATIDTEIPKKKYIKQDKNLKRQLKQDPKAANYQGTHIKFTENGSIFCKPQENDLSLNVKTPGEEFEYKKSTWQIKPIPKRRPKFNSATQSILNKDGLAKQSVKRFGEINPELEIKEIYEYNENDYEMVQPTDLKLGDDVLFKTLELNEEYLTPSMSQTKRGVIKDLDDKSVTVKLIRNIDENEQRMIENIEILDDIMWQKYEITLEKHWLVDLKVKRLNNAQ